MSIVEKNAEKISNRRGLSSERRAKSGSSFSFLWGVKVDNGKRNAFYQSIVVIVVARFIFIKFTSKRLIIKVVAAGWLRAASSNFSFSFVARSRVDVSQFPQFFRYIAQIPIYSICIYLPYKYIYRIYIVDHTPAVQRVGCEKHQCDYRSRIKESVCAPSKKNSTHLDSTRLDSQLVQLNVPRRHANKCAKVNQIQIVELQCCPQPTQLTATQQGPNGRLG